MQGSLMVLGQAIISCYKKLFYNFDKARLSVKPLKSLYKQAWAIQSPRSDYLIWMVCSAILISQNWFS